MLGAVPPPAARPLGRAAGVRLVWVWGPSTGPPACALAGRRCALWGWRKGVPEGGCLALLCRASEVRRSPFLNCPHEEMNSYT